MAKVNDQMTLEEAEKLKEGDYVECRFGKTWHRVQLMEDPVLADHKASELDFGMPVVYLTATNPHRDVTVKFIVGLPQATWSDGMPFVRMDGYCREALKEELQYVRDELTEEPSDLCQTLHEPTWEEHRAAMDNVIECAVERIMKRMGL